jgi:GPH family glycoside/pentoside/hexuronide:cation symporter
MGLVFGPPPGLSMVLLFGWLTLTKMGVRALASVYNIPYYALGGELTDDYVDRTRIVAYRLLAGIAVTVAITFLASSVFFKGEGGLQIPERYPAFGWTIGIGMMVIALIACAGVWRHALTLPQPKEAAPNMLRRLPGELAEIFRNKSFLILFFSLLLFSSAAGVNQALNTHAAVFVWQLRPELLQVPAYAYLFALLVATPLTPFMLRWMEKKTASMVGLLTVMAPWTLLAGARALGLYAPTGPEALPALIVMSFFVGLGSGIIFVAIPSMMADAADEHEHVYGHRREGLYFSGIGFGSKAAAGMGALLGGLTLDILHFPKEAGRQVHAVIPADTLAGLVVGWGLFPAALCVVGAIVLAPYALGRARQSEVADAIRTKRANAA